MAIEEAVQLDRADVPGPKRLPHAVDVPESLKYRFKKKLLGPPLATERLAHERLGIPTALAVFSSDCISSSAYATEQILVRLVPIIGVLAFSLVVPITVALLVVLFFLILSYRETIKEYPTAGGAYMVTRDNFGLLPAQVAGVSLLTDYILTVAVSVAAGTDALTSAVSALAPYHVVIALFFVILIAYGNLRGVRESGKLFAVPTYFFIAMMGLLIVVGVVRAIGGSLHPQNLHNLKGAVPIGVHGGLNQGLLFGASLWLVLKAFASGGAAVTGVEAISNGVTAFRRPEWLNARRTLFIMGGTLGALFLGLSILSTQTHPIPYISGTPTVISQVGKIVFGAGPIGHTLFYLLQVGTLLILVLAANTSFADFPRLASFHAGDNFMPRQLTKRGHRLVFSNGIISLAVAASIVLLGTGAKVDRLIPLYAIGVFTSFTMSQAGMAKHHLTHKEPGWHKGLFVNGTGAVLSLIVDVIILLTKFTAGAWVVVVLIPIMVYGITRLNKEYESEAEELAEDAPRAAEAPILRRHVVFVLIENLDVASARAIQYARTLAPDELRAVHFVLDREHADHLTEEWRRLGLSRLPLELIDVPDRRLTRVAVELCAETLMDGDTEVSLLLPRRAYTRSWHRLLHDRTADSIAAAVGNLPHANVTFVPYHLGQSGRQRELESMLAAETGRKRSAGRRGAKREAKTLTAVAEAPIVAAAEVPEGVTPIADVTYRQRARVAGRIRSQRVQPWAGVATLECVIVDGTGGVNLVFLGRKHVAGLAPGVRLVAEGMVGDHGGKLAILNPLYRILPEPDVEAPPTHH
ncbi:MAG TPA: amino acid permease [Acidimicrobiales bacterium]|nr:amino acid permease [Acidimicrobiales bacterium]